MKIPKEVSHCLYSRGIKSNLLYSESLCRIWFIDNGRFSRTQYSTKELADMNFILVKLKPIVLENK